MSGWVAERKPLTVEGLLVGCLVAACALVGLLAGVRPEWAILASAALAFAMLAVWDLTAGVIAYMVVVFLETGALATPLIAGTIVLAVAWLIQSSNRPERRQTTLFGDYPLAGALIAFLLVWTALSAAWAEEPGTAGADVIRYLINLALLVIVYAAAQTRVRALWVLGGFAVVASVSSVYGLITSPTADPEGFRFEGSLGDPNVLAAVLIAGLFLAGAGAAALRSAPALRLGAIAASGVCMVGLLLTVSRGGLIALGVALVVAVVVAGRWRPYVFACVVVTVAIGAYYFAFLAPADARERVEQATSGQVRVQESRFTIWNVGWRVVSDNLVLGVGAGNFPNAAVHSLLDDPGATPRSDLIVDEPKAAHNTYLHVFAELGFPGVAAFLGIVVFSIGSGVAAVRNFKRAGDREMEIMSRALIVALAGFLAACTFISMQTNNKLWLLLALGPALYAVSRPDRPGS